MIFHNPYHFVPVAPEPETVASREDLAAGRSAHVTHDRYLGGAPSGNDEPQIFSGRLICRLTTLDPVFIGDERDPESRRVSSFKLDGKPAIPASSLRGLLSSIAEAASNSALRVLDNRLLSRRMDFDAQENLPALGMIVKVTDTNGNSSLRLRPLTLPPMSWDVEQKRGRLDRTLSAYAEMCRRLPPGLQSHVPLKIFVDGYEADSTCTPPVLRVSRPSFLEIAPDSYSADKRAFWYIPVNRLPAWVDDGKSRVTTRRPHLKRIETRSGPRWFLLGQQADGEGPISQAEYENRGKPAGYVRGILRVLGIEGREANMPTGKKHEIFIPYPEGMDDALTYDIEAALEKFHDLADQRTLEERKQLLPFAVKGSDRNDDRDKFKNKLRLRDGDLVFFRAEGGGDDAAAAPGPDRGRGGFATLGDALRARGVVPSSQPAADVKITEIAVSSIWRSAAGGYVHEFFGKISKDLLPFNPDRHRVTMAEAMFGFVEHRGKGARREGAEALALASRIRVSFGCLGAAEKEPYYRPEVELKALLSPKPPSPSLYFKNSEGLAAHIAKRNLSLTRHEPQGRKFYLHRDSRPEADSEPWKTQAKDADGSEMRSIIEPIQPRRQFFFHVDFDNLTRDELGLLCYAARPAESFRHKLGMGKPIGLGKVCLDPIGLFFVDRLARYRAGGFGLATPRYHGMGLAPGMPDRPGDLAGDLDEDQRTLAALQALYPRELAEWLRLAAARQGPPAASQAWPTFDQLRDGFRDRMNTMNRDILQALERLGDPETVQLPVHTPQVLGVKGAAMEEKSYEWFVSNDRDQQMKEYLKPLAESPDALPPLRRLPRPRSRP